MADNEPAFFIREGKKIMRQPVECYSRVVGYLSPVHRWNNGKKEEFHDRLNYKI